MAAKDWSREIATVSQYILGATVEVRGECAQPISGITQSVDSSVAGLASLAENSVDSLISVGGLERLTDPIAGLRSMRRALREGGQLVLVVQVHESTADNPHGSARYSPQYLAALLVLVSGFAVGTIDEVTAGETFIIVCKRSAVEQVRQPFGAHGQGMVQQVNSSPAARAEYYFQMATLMLQTGDQEWAVQCFQNVLTLEPDNSEAFFGLGMTLGTQNRWVEAQVYLQRAQILDPQNTEIQRWMQLATQQQAPVQQPAPVPPPAVQPNIRIPQTSPGAGLRTPSQMPARDANPGPAPAGLGVGGAGIPSQPLAQAPANPPAATLGSLRI